MIALSSTGTYSAAQLCNSFGLPDDNRPINICKLNTDFSKFMRCFANEKALFTNAKAITKSN